MKNATDQVTEFYRSIATAAVVAAIVRELAVKGANSGEGR